LALAIEGTPVFFINGQAIQSGPNTVEEWQDIITAILSSKP
jgi:protein-disulfide isomerase